MLTKPSSCSGCVLEHTGKGFVPDEVVAHPNYAIIAEAPGSTEVAQGKPLVGKAGFVLKSWIMKAVPQIQVAYEQQKVSLCNVLKCQPPMDKQGRPYPKGQERLDAEAHCRQYLNIGNPKVVILCGETPQRYFFGPELEAEDAVDRVLGHDLKGVTGRIGRVYERAGIKYVFSLHPAFVLRQPSLVAHAQEAFKIAAGIDKTLDVHYVGWEQAMACAY